jgi:hypothetical protein
MPSGKGRHTVLVVARVGIALVAVMMVAWFGVLARNHAIGNRASERLVSNPNMGAAEWQRSMHDFERADVLDPSTDWRLTEGQYQLLRDKRAALRTANWVIRREPDNLGAWWLAMRAARGIDPARWHQATAQIERLNPTPATR